MRWTASRKAELLDRIAANPDQSAEIMAENRVSAEELIGWRRSVEERGRAGLMTTATDGRTGKAWAQ